MERKRKLYIAKAAVVVVAIPLLLWAHDYGPDVGHAGVPNENGTCSQSQCHVGIPVNSGGGSTTINFPNGKSYVPGVTQHLTVTISDSAQHAWGFQLAARTSASTSTQAGAFSSSDINTLVMCATTNADINSEVQLNFGASQSCPSAKPLGYIEHSLAGYQATRFQPSGIYHIDWTPPSTNVGNIIFYLAGNAANGDDSVNGDHIYTTTYTLTPSAGGSAPTISGVSNAAGGQAGVFPNSWVSIYGSNFAPAGFTDFWDKSIVNGKLPTTLDNISVSIGGQPAYVYYVSSGQINVIAPNVGFGTMPVTVTTSTGTSAAFTANSQQYGPAFFPWPNGQPVATHADFTNAAASGTFAGTTTVPAKPGEAVILWGTGFGPTSPTEPIGVQIPASPTYYVATPATMTIGGTPASVYATALAGGFAGLYQLVVTVPSSMANGSYPVIATINGAQTPTGYSLTIHN